MARGRTSPGHSLAVLTTTTERQNCDDSSRSRLRTPGYRAVSAALDERSYQQALYAAAMLYVDQGFAVIPLGPVVYTDATHKDVRPLIKWQSDPASLVTKHEHVEKWFGMIGRARGIALATGPSNLLMVDLDDYKTGYTGVDLPPGGWVERGGRGGGHVYFRNPTGARNTADSTRKVDTRGVGGLVICTPTICTMHDGTFSQWATERPLGELHAAGLPEAPIELLGARPAIRRLGVVGEPTEITPERAAAAVAAGRVDWLGSVTGGRHDAMVAYLGSLARYLMAQGLPTQDIAGELEAAALEHPDAVAGEDFASMPDAIAWAIGKARSEPWILAEPSGFAARFSAPPTPSAPAGHLPTLSGEFWASREVLTHIRVAAWARRLSPDAVLHAILARLAAGRRAAILIDSGIEPSSLNYFAAVIGASGSGKSRAWKLAGRLLALDPDDCPTRPLGSGEGISEAFMGTVTTTDEVTLKTVKERVQVRSNLLFELDEGQTLTAMLQRNGATIGPALRSAWSGAVLGQQNADAERNRRVVDYATGLVAGFQPDAMQALIQDTHTGMPQRFAFVAASDPAMPKDRPENPGPLTQDLAAVLAGQAANPFTSAIAHGTVLSVPGEVTDEIDGVLLAVGTGAVTPPELDSQRIGMMLRLSGLLALLEGRFAVSGEDWALAGALWGSSVAVRDTVVARAAEAEERARERGNQFYAERQAHAASAVALAPKAVLRIATKLTKRVLIEGECSRSDARRGISSRDRGMFELAVEYAVGEGWLLASDTKLKPGPVAT